MGFSLFDYKWLDSIESGLCTLSAPCRGGVGERGPGFRRPCVAVRVFSPWKDVYDRAVWVTENRSPPTRTNQNNQYMALRFNCTASIPTRPGDPVAGPAVRGLDSSFIHRTAGANLEGAGEARSPRMPARSPGYLVASMSRSGGTHRTANPVLTEGNSSRTGTRR